MDDSGDNRRPGSLPLRASSIPDSAVPGIGSERIQAEILKHGFGLQSHRNYVIIKRNLGLGIKHT